MSNPATSWCWRTRTKPPWTTTLREGVAAAFWSLSRDSLWVKGETSGNRLDIVDVRVNCEQNSLLYLVRLR